MSNPSPPSYPPSHGHGESVEGWMARNALHLVVALLVGLFGWSAEPDARRRRRGHRAEHGAARTAERCAGRRAGGAGEPRAAHRAPGAPPRPHRTARAALTRFSHGHAYRHPPLRRRHPARAGAAPPALAPAHSQAARGRRGRAPRGRAATARQRRACSAPASPPSPPTTCARCGTSASRPTARSPRLWRGLAAYLTRPRAEDAPVKDDRPLVVDVP